MSIASVNGITIGYDDVGDGQNVLVLIHGRRPGCLHHPRADADLMHALLKGSELVWMEGVGHMPNLERADEFNKLLERFLKGVTVATSRPGSEAETGNSNQ